MVVRHVPRWIDAACGPPGTIERLMIERDRVAIGFDGVGVSPNADVDVRRHVDEMTRARHQRRETLGATDGAHGIARFDRVDVEMARAGMVGIRLHNGVELLEDRRRSGRIEPSRFQ